MCFGASSEYTPIRLDLLDCLRCLVRPDLQEKPLTICRVNIQLSQQRLIRPKLIVFNFSSSSGMPMMEAPLGCDGRSIRVAGKTSAIGAGAAHDSRRPASAIASRQWSPSPNTSGEPASAAKRMLRRRHGEGARRQLCRYVGEVLREIPADLIGGTQDWRRVVVAVAMRAAGFDPVMGWPIPRLLK